jgi:NAD(P)-dependent dehydrogenase (short-subunit alcohol dehydrogenase family)
LAAQNDQSRSSSALTNDASDTSASTPMKHVDGKVAFITGGDSGIGMGIAVALLNAGMKIVTTYRTRVHLDHALKTWGEAANRVHAIDVDVTDRAAIAAAADETVRVFGKVHVLINNAGVALMTPMSSATFDDWDWCMNVNVNGVFNCVQAFLPHIQSHGEGGQIVATSSMLGGLIAGPFWGVYSTTKFAVVGMMEALRSELASSNIGVSVFCPAGVESNLGRSHRNRPAHLSEAGTPGSNTRPLMEAFRKEAAKVMEHKDEWNPVMSPTEAGQRVLQGIRNNDLYILSHPEYEQAIRERYEALLASIPRNEPPVSQGRLAIARISHNPIYAQELRRKAAM